MKSCRSLKVKGSHRASTTPSSNPLYRRNPPPSTSIAPAPLIAACPHGAHGLPLMGTGDWNDGMNRVGEHGKGESVWLGWFLLATLKTFAPVADARGDVKRAAAWRDRDKRTSGRA